MIIAWKSLVCTFIFTLMFVSSWWLNDLSKRSIYNQSSSAEIPEIMNVHELKYGKQVLMIEPFKPREYIKIHENI